MTKVLFGEIMLEYQREMMETLRRVIQHQFIDGVSVRSRTEPPLAQLDLLPPPGIETIDLMGYEGKIDNVILIATSDDFGIENLHVMIHDDKGNLIESGEAMEEPEVSGFWAYFAEVAVPSGTSVIVQAIATDCFGSVGVLCERRTIP